MELDQALAQISEIRRHVARSETFRGYRATTVAFSAIVAIAAAFAQGLLIADPAAQTGSWLALWVSGAALCLLVTGVEMAVRGARARSPWSIELAWMAIEQFSPSVLAGGLLTFVMAKFIPESMWMLPGLWAILFSLGVFASRRLLPRAVFWVAAWYMVAGVLCLAYGGPVSAFSPWTMGATFGAGQLLAAGILYVTLERPHD